jgi:hypothetical protein
MCIHILYVFFSHLMVLKRVSSLCSTSDEGSQMETEMDSTVLTYTVVSI